MSTNTEPAAAAVDLDEVNEELDAELEAIRAITRSHPTASNLAGGAPDAASDAASDDGLADDATQEIRRLSTAAQSLLSLNKEGEVLEGLLGDGLPDQSDSLLDAGGDDDAERSSVSGTVHEVCCRVHWNGTCSCWAGRHCGCRLCPSAYPAGAGNSGSACCW